MADDDEPVSPEWVATFGLGFIQGCAWMAGKRAPRVLN